MRLQAERMQSAALKDEAEQTFEQLLRETTEPTLTLRIRKSMEALRQDK
jgi:hypothetical protein